MRRPVDGSQYSAGERVRVAAGGEHERRQHGDERQHGEQPAGAAAPAGLRPGPASTWNTTTSGRQNARNGSMLVPTPRVT